jgi:hypothetical protein
VSGFWLARIAQDMKLNQTNFRNFPTIDYESHPKYGGTFGKISVREKIRALKEYWPHLKLGIYEFKENSKRRFKNRSLYSNDSKNVDYLSFQEKGILLKTVDLKIVNKLKGYLNDHIGHDMDRIKIKGGEERHYIAFAECDPTISELHDQLLQELDIYEIAKMYMSAKNVLISGWKLRIQQHDPFFKTNLYEDSEPYTPATNYMHVDSSLPRKQIKMIFYLGDVTQSNGPFTYVQGSHKLKDPVWRVILRRVNHITGLQKWDINSRRNFYSLPKMFQHKAEIGNDFRDEDPAAKRLIADEIRVTSDMGNFILFDNSGIHRGGLINEGRRISLQWTIHAQN